MSLEREISELLADAKEHMLYLRELGVEGLGVEMPERPLSQGVVYHPVIGQKTAAATSPDQGGESLSGRPASPPRLPANAPGIHPSLDKEGSFGGAADVSRVAAPNEISSILEAKSRTPADTDLAPGKRLAALPSLKKRKQVVDKIEMGTAKRVEDVPVESVAVPARAAEESLFGDASKGLPESAESMEDIWNDVGNCTRCPLFEGRTQIVHTTGNFNADLMFVGEAPGADEDAKGEPFVGRAGQLLNKIIEAIGMTRDQVAIGNINRCRPPGNRTPTLPEAHTCRPFLLREIAVIRPKVIVVLGNTALHNLLDTKVGITKVRGKFQDYYGVKVMPTFHPAYLLRDPSKKRETWEDMKMVRDYLGSVGS
jgi:uracil-DNA glycosylase